MDSSPSPLKMFQSLLELGFAISVILFLVPAPNTYTFNLYRQIIQRKQDHFIILIAERHAVPLSFSCGCWGILHLYPLQVVTGGTEEGPATREARAPSHTWMLAAAEEASDFY